MKYIDADKLMKFKEALADIIVSSQGICTYQDCKDIAEREASLLIATLQQEQDHFAEASKMEPEVDLEKAFAHEYAIYHLPNFIVASIVNGMELIDFIYETARHFYEFGLNARKEE